jgi:hypothetical protein
VVGGDGLGIVFALNSFWEEERGAGLFAGLGDREARAPRNLGWVGWLDGEGGRAEQLARAALGEATCQ